MSEVDLPLGWSTPTIGVVCRLINGRAFKPSDWTHEGLPIVRIQNLNNPASKFNRCNKPVEERFLIDDGELLFAWSGTPGTSFGAHIWHGGKAVLNQHIFRVLFDEEVVDKKFLRFAINERLDHLIGSAHGGAGLAHVTKPVFEATSIALPPLAEQRRIVAKVEAVLARSRRAREALDPIPALLEQFRQSVLAATFQGDLTSEWREQHPNSEPASKLLERIRVERRHRWEAAELERMWARGKAPQGDEWKGRYEEPLSFDGVGLPELPDGWCWTTLDTILDSLRNGIAAKPEESEGLPILRISAVRPMVLDLADVRYLAKSDDYQEYDLADGDLLFTRYNGNAELVGACGVVRGILSRLVYPDKMIRGRTLAPLVEPDFIAFAMASGASKDWIRAKSKSAAGQVGISGADLKAVPVPLAPLAEQRVLVTQIGGMLARCDEVKSVALGALMQTRDFDTTLLAKAFRGELVEQDPTDEPASVLLDGIRRGRAETEKPVSRKTKTAGG